MWAWYDCSWALVGLEYSCIKFCWSGLSALSLWPQPEGAFHSKEKGWKNFWASVALLVVARAPCFKACLQRVMEPHESKRPFQLMLLSAELRVLLSKLACRCWSSPFPPNRSTPDQPCATCCVPIWNSSSPLCPSARWTGELNLALCRTAADCSLCACTWAMP